MDSARRDAHGTQSSDRRVARLADVGWRLGRSRAREPCGAPWMSSVMFGVLVDYARPRGRGKRGAGVSVTSLDETATAPQPAVDIVALDDTLERLGAVDPQQSRVVELRFFAGLSVKETAEALGVSAATLKRDWATGKLWPYNELTTR